MNQPAEQIEPVAPTVEETLSSWLAKQNLENVTTVGKLLEGSLCRDPRQHRKATEIYQKIENLPIGDLHTHYDPVQITQNIPWENPTQVFLGRPAKLLGADQPNFGFDHYVAQLMNSHGVNPDIVYGFKSNEAEPELDFERRRFDAMINVMYDAPGSKEAIWLKISLESVFDIYDEITPENADSIWNQCIEKLKTEEFRPQEMLQNAGVKYALTTDDPTADLGQHGTNTNGPKLIPTWRADAVLVMEDMGENGRYAFSSWIGKLSAAASTEITDLNSLENALDNRLQYFKQHGCIAADLGLANFTFEECSAQEADAIFKKKLGGTEPTLVEKLKWHSYMLEWLLTKNAEYSFKQYLHQGPRRDQNANLYKIYGPDIGGDGPGEALNRKAFIDLLRKLDSKPVEGSIDGTGLAPTVVFPLSSTDYEFVLNNITAFQTNLAGIPGKIQLGPPWWFNDTREGNANVIREQISRGTLKHWIGMLSDARSLTSVIARMKLFRAILAAELACELTDLSTSEIVERFAEPVCFENGRKFLGVSIGQEDK